MLTLQLVLSAAAALPAHVHPLAVPPTPAAVERGEPVRGELVDPSTCGPSWVESMEDVIRRERESPAPSNVVRERHRPMVPPWFDVAKPAPASGSGGSGGTQALGGGGTAPTLSTNFVGPKLGDAGGGWIPPDSCGAIGPNHFVSIVNSNISVWNKTTGARLMNVGQSAFWGTGGTSLGDGRGTYDPHSGRFILSTEDFNTRLYIAVSTTSDPTGTWFKTSFVCSQGVDAGHWPDYQTLGVDANGVYLAAYMVGAPDNMSIFALDKAPLVAGAPSLGNVWAFRSLPWEGAIHPCVTYGTPPGEYFVSRPNGSQLRLRRLDPPLSGGTPPTMSVDTVFSTGVSTSSPPNAPNMGGGTLDTLDARPMNAVYRNGSVWTTHGVAASGRAGCRWYQINTGPIAVTQTGLVDDPVLYYFMPGISVNANNHMVVGFTGSSASQFAGCYVTGRKSTDPAGQTGAPFQFKAGEGNYQDGGNPSRWGDYSLTSVDPVNDLDFWTIQEYARAGNIWGTWIAKLVYDNCLIVSPSNFCISAPNSTGNGAFMASSGSTLVGQNDFVLETYQLPPNKTCLYLYGQNQIAPVTFGNGFRCIGSPFFRIYPAGTSSPFGDLIYPVDLNALPLAGQINGGETWSFMCWYRDPPAGGALYNGSDALETHWCQ